LSEEIVTYGEIVREGREGIDGDRLGTTLEKLSRLQGVVESICEIIR